MASFGAARRAVFALLVLLCLASVAVQVAFAAEQATSITLDQFMDLVAADLGKSHAYIAPYTQKLKDEWLSDVNGLNSVADKKWASMGFPNTLVSAIRELLAVVCSAKSDCSNHGACLNNRCKCDSGWGGGHCQNKIQCTLECQHGGFPSDDCTRCVGCRGAWTGVRCDQWDSSVSATQLVKELEGYARDAKTNVQSINLVRPLPGRVGLGVDITTGQFKLPVVKLTYTDETKTWTNSKKVVYRRPVEATFTTLPTGISQPQLQSNVFTSMRQYMDHMAHPTGQLRSGVGGLFSHSNDLDAVYNRYFTGDDLLTVTQQLYSIFKLVIPNDPKTKEPNCQLDVHAQRALDSLPPDYSTPASKQAYRTFVENWGTSFTTTAIQGGIVEMQTYFSSSLLTDPVNPLKKSYTVDQLAQQASYDYMVRTGGSGKPDQAYTERRQLGTIDCFGGDPTACGNKKLAAWAKTIEQNPVTISYVLNDNTVLIKDKALRTRVQQAIRAYVTEMTDKIRKQKTCPICTPRGTCKAPAETCKCSNPNIIGRTCNRCASGWKGADCKTPICSSPCSHGTCVGPNTCKCQGHWAPPTCSVCASGWSGRDCNVGQKCIKCRGSGKVCHPSGCKRGSVACSVCSGAGQVAKNLPVCYKCKGQGAVCSPAGCKRGTVVCPGCAGKSYLAATAKKCPKCKGQGTVCNPRGCKHGQVTCASCSNKGWV